MMVTMTVRKRNSGMSFGICQGHAIDREPMNHCFLRSKWHVAAAAFLLLYRHESNVDPWPVFGSL